MTVFLKNLDLSKINGYQQKQKKAATKARKTTSKKKRQHTPNNDMTPFPIKLFQMLTEVELQGGKYLDIVSWNPDGTSFLVHDPTKFVEHILPSYFKQTKYKSFLRQLQFYGFQRIKASGHPLHGSYQHPQFIKGNDNLCKNIRRVTPAAPSTTRAGITTSTATRMLAATPVDDQWLATMTQVVINNTTINNTMDDGDDSTMSYSSSDSSPSSSEECSIDNEALQKEEEEDSEDNEKKIMKDDDEVSIKEISIMMKEIDEEIFNLDHATCNNVAVDANNNSRGQRRDSFFAAIDNLAGIMTNPPSLDVATTFTPIQLQEQLLSKCWY